MLDIKLYTFIKVVELRNYTAAANELGLTQPAVSQHIAKLEENYNRKFIEIKGKAIFLTQEGELFYQYARQVLSNEQIFLKRLDKCNPKMKIGATLSIADYYLTNLLLIVYQQGIIDVEVCVGITENLLEKVINV